MTEKQYIKKGVEEAQEAFKEKLTKVVKEMTLATLEAIENKKAEKAKVEEELRVLKLDLEDLQNGRIDKVKERQKKSEVARGVSKIVIRQIEQPWQFMDSITTMPPSISDDFFTTATAGTYTVSSGNCYYIS